MTLRTTTAALSLLLLCGCATWSLVPAGPVTVGALHLTSHAAWNKAPSLVLPQARKGAVVWTQDGLMLDRLVIVPAVPDGEPLFKDRKGHAALPRFKAGMLPNELEDLAESSVTKLMGEGDAAVTTSRLRPHRYGEHGGILLDLDASITDGPDYKGVAGAFEANGQLYFLLYLAATPHYFDKHLAEAEAIIKSATLAPHL